MKISDTYFSHPDKCYNDHIARIGQSFPSDERHQICALYHDLGKLSDAFQKYIQLKQTDFNSKESFEKARNKLKTTHTLESAYLYFCNEENKNIEFLANFFTILKHHANLPDLAYYMNQYLSTIDNKIDCNRLEIFETISKIAQINFNNDIYGFMDFFDDVSDSDTYKKTENFFLFKERYSRLILADKFEAIFSKSYQNVKVLSEDTINKHLAKIQTTIEQKQKERPNAYRTQARDAIFETFKTCDRENKFLIKAPTGIGKTFIALELALKIAKKRKNKRRIITAIPFTSIIDQTHLEYEKILGDGSVLKYHHLTKQKELDEADEKEQFSQKVFLADIWQEHFIVTTFNQLLYTFFSNHNRDNVRLETLRDSVIIIDEIQNISRVLLKSVSFILNEFASRYNIDFIIMSATMPYIYEELQTFKELSNDSFYHTKKDRYTLYYDPNIREYETLKEAILKEEGSVLCVVNTIEKAKTMYQLINDDTCYLLTTHQTPQHRKVIIRLVHYLLKKKAKITLIATQLIEAGVDLDFDVGYREFAPFASIIQMAGRVNREGRHKGACKVTVFDYLEEKTLPYHQIDLQETKIKTLLQTPLSEKEILSDMDTYFVSIKTETTSVNLEKHITALEFQTLFQKFNDNFMPNQPWKVSLFIEQKNDHFKEFIEKRENFLVEKDVFEALNRIKDLEKDLGRHTISVSQNLIDELQKKENIDEKSGRYILKYDSRYYTKKRGFDLNLTMVEEAFS